MKEQGYQSKVLNLLKDKGAYTIKVVSGSKKGVPDIVACYKGKFIGIEMKKPDTMEDTSKLQEYNLKKIKEAGGYSLVVSNNINDILNVLKEIDNE